MKNREGMLRSGFLVLIGIVSIFGFLSLVSSFSFNGTVRNTDGNLLSNVTVNVTVRSTVDFSVVGYNSTTTNESGWFNMTVPDNVAWLYSPTLSIKNVSFANATTFIGQNLPVFPSFVYDNLGVIPFYLREAGNINISAINISANRIGFNYQIKDARTGYIIASSMGPTNTVTEALVAVPRDRNYSILIFPNQSLPVSFNWDNFSSTVSYTILNNVAGNLSKFNVTTRTLHKMFNMTLGVARVTGFVNASNVSDVYGFDNITIVPFLLEPGNMIHATHGALPYNMSAFVAGTTDVYTLTTGFYNITLPAPAETANYLLYATARNGTRYLGGFGPVNLTYGGGDAQRNISAYGLLGSLSNLSMTSATNFANKVLVESKKQTFRAINISNLTLAQSNLHTETTVDYSNYGAIQFTWMEDVPQESAANFSLVLLNVTGVKEMNVFAGGGDYAPKRLSLSVRDLVASSNLTGNVSNITITGFNPQAIDSVLSTGNIKMGLYVSNVTCDVPYPPTSCNVGGASSMDDFNPMTSLIGGGRLSFRMGKGNITVHYVNVDMIACGPPDALFDTATSNSTGGNSFSSAVRFGSSGPTIYDYVMVSMPYIEATGAGLNDTSAVNISIPHFYDDNWNLIWNSTANGTDVGRMKGNNSHYADRQSEWAYLLNQTTCTTNATSALSNISVPCFIDTAGNMAWLRLPHFSGTGPSLSGTSVPASSGGSSSSSSGGGGGAATQKVFWTYSHSFHNEELSEKGEIQVDMRERQRARVRIGGETHQVGIQQLSDSEVTLNVTSEPQYATLKIGESKKFEVSGDGYYDIFVSLNGINDMRADLKLAYIHELVPVAGSDAGVGIQDGIREGGGGTSPIQTSPTPEPLVESLKAKTLIYVLLIVLGVIIAGLIVLGLHYFKKKRNQKRGYW